MTLSELHKHVVEIAFPNKTDFDMPTVIAIACMCDILSEHRGLQHNYCKTPLYRFLMASRLSNCNMGTMISALNGVENESGYDVIIACYIALAGCGELPQSARDMYSSMADYYQKLRRLEVV